MVPASLSLQLYERTDGNDWISDPIVSGSFTVQLMSSKPPYLQILASDSSLEVVGRVYSGWAGVWPILLKITEPGEVISYMTLYLEILPFWQKDSDFLFQDDLNLGQFYYELCGGPLRKEYQWAS